MIDQVLILIPYRWKIRLDIIKLIFFIKLICKTKIIVFTINKILINFRFIFWNQSVLLVTSFTSKLFLNRNFFLRYFSSDILTRLVTFLGNDAFKNMDPGLFTHFQLHEVVTTDLQHFTFLWNTAQWTFVKRYIFIWFILQILLLIMVIVKSGIFVILNSVLFGGV